MGNIVIPDNLGFLSWKKNSSISNNDTITYNENNKLEILTLEDDFMTGVRIIGDSVNRQRWKNKTSALRLPVLNSDGSCRFEYRGANDFPTACYPDDGYTQSLTPFDSNNFDIEIKTKNHANINTYTDSGNTPGREMVFLFWVVFSSTAWGNAKNNWYRIRILDYHSVTYKWRIIIEWCEDNTTGYYTYKSSISPHNPLPEDCFRIVKTGGNKCEAYCGVGTANIKMTTSSATGARTFAGFNTNKLALNNWFVQIFASAGTGAWPYADIDYIKINSADRKYYVLGSIISAIIDTNNSLYNYLIKDLFLNAITNSYKTYYKISDKKPSGTKLGTFIDNDGLSHDYYAADSTWLGGNWIESKTITDYIQINQAGNYIQIRIDLLGDGNSTPTLGKIILNYGEAMKVKYDNNFSTEKIIEGPYIEDYFRGNDEIISTGYTSNNSIKQLGSKNHPQKIKIKYTNVSKQCVDDWYAIKNFTTASTTINRQIQIYPNEVSEPSLFYQGFLSLIWELNKDKNERYNLEVEIKERL